MSDEKAGTAVLNRQSLSGRNMRSVDVIEAPQARGGPVPSDTLLPPLPENPASGYGNLPGTLHVLGMHTALAPHLPHSGAYQYLPGSGQGNVYGYGGYGYPYPVAHHAATLGGPGMPPLPPGEQIHHLEHEEAGAGNDFDQKSLHPSNATCREGSSTNETGMSTCATKMTWSDYAKCASLTCFVRHPEEDSFILATAIAVGP